MSKARQHKPRSRTQKLSHHSRSLLHAIFGAVILALILVGIWFTAAALSFHLTPASPNYTFGTSFSPRHAADFGLDWKENYTALLDDLEIRSYRLMSYWDDIEATPDAYAFDDLDWQMDEAAKRGAKVSLAIGLRQPRWPECHEPAWAVNLSEAQWRTEFFDYLEKVVKRYENHPALESFQLENEAFAWWFGDCRLQPDRELLQAEFAQVKSWTDTPILMSLSDQYGIPLQGPIADSYGYSLYTKVYNSLIPGTYVEPSPPIWYHRARADVLRSVYGTPLFVHELQLEPWGAQSTRLLTVAEQDKTMNAERINYNLLYARKLGIENIYTWGSEWWYWRLQQGDPSIWNAVKEAVRESKGAEN